MADPNYKYKCWFQKAGPLSGKYRLQVFEPGQHKEYLYLMQWNFESPKEIYTFLRDYFPSVQRADWSSTSKNIVDINAELSSGGKVVDIKRSLQSGENLHHSQRADSSSIRRANSNRGRSRFHLFSIAGSLMQLVSLGTSET